MPLFGETLNPAEFRMIEIDASKYIRLTEGKGCFAQRDRQANIFEIRYDYSEPEEKAQMDGVPAGEKNGPAQIRWIFNMRGLRDYIPNCRKEPAINEGE